MNNVYKIISQHLLSYADSTAETSVKEIYEGRDVYFVIKFTDEHGFIWKIKKTTLISLCFVRKLKIKNNEEYIESAIFASYFMLDPDKGWAYKYLDEFSLKNGYIYFNKF